MSNNFTGSREPEGLVTVELYCNKDMKKLNEVKTHNFISKQVKNFFYRYVFNSLFTRNISGKDSAFTSMAMDVSNPFGVLMLTDASHDESPADERYVKGNLMGFAYTSNTYSGSGPLRGTLNVDETEIRADKVRLVFDFATDKANGTFQSIHFGFDDMPYKENGKLATLNQIPNFNLVPDNCVVIRKYNGDYYVISRDDTKLIKVYDSNFSLIRTITLADVGWGTIAGFSDFTIYNNILYTVHSYGSGYYGGVRSLNLQTNVKGYSGEAPTPFDYGIDYDETTGHLMVVRPDRGRISNIYAGTSFIDIYDLSLNRIESVVIEASADLPRFGYRDLSRVRPLVADQGILHLSSNYDDNPNFFEPTLRIKRLTPNGVFTVLPTIANTILGNYDDNYFIGRWGKLIPKGDLSSRVKLPEAVTKTSTNTMKITYEFVLPTIGW